MRHLTIPTGGRPLAYNFPPRRRAILSSMGTVLILPVAAFGQVKISLSAQRHKVREEIHAKVENTGSRPVTFCVEFGQTSPKAGEIVSTPSPFWRHQNSLGNWDTLMIGPGCRQPESRRGAGGREVNGLSLPLERFRKNAAATQLLARRYSEIGLPYPPKHSKLATSAVFTIN
jgi:hypothetical protein